MTTHDRNVDPQVTRALQELLAGREPDPSDVQPLTGDVRACLNALIDALHTDGVQAVRQSFLALAKDRPWLTRLASTQAPGADTPEQPTRRIRFLPDSEFENRPPRQWLIPSVLPKEGIALIFGPPGCGKSFLTMAWSLCIASGREWLGHPVLQGPVAYIAGEGSFGIGPRLKAWKMFHQFTGDSGVKWFDESLALQDAGNFNELVTAFTEDFEEPPVLVVIDTLSRCSGGAEENSNTEMAKVIAAADMLQQRFHCTVLIVHHAGKDRDKGPRGASSLIGNTETILEVAPTDQGCRVVCYKQKDAPKFDPISLKLQSVQYGTEEGDTSAVLVMGDEKARPKMKPSESAMYAALIGKQLTHTEWKNAGLAVKLGDGTAKNAIAALVKAGLVQKIGKLYSIPASSEEDTEPTKNDENE
jgi:hypothetical protein